MQRLLLLAGLALLSACQPAEYGVRSHTTVGSIPRNNRGDAVLDGQVLRPAGAVAPAALAPKPESCQHRKHCP